LNIFRRVEKGAKLRRRASFTFNNLCNVLAQVQQRHCMQPRAHQAGVGAAAVSVTATAASLKHSFCHRYPVSAQHHTPFRGSSVKFHFKDIEPNFGIILNEELLPSAKVLVLPPVAAAPPPAPRACTAPPRLKRATCKIIEQQRVYGTILSCTGCRFVPLYFLQDEGAALTSSSGWSPRRAVFFVMTLSLSVRRRFSSNLCHRSHHFIPFHVFYLQQQRVTPPPLTCLHDSPLKCRASPSARPSSACPFPAL
jgi:hypothetical protein